jgi:diguanylate cyclase (GGDEF)-like protein
MTPSKRASRPAAIRRDTLWILGLGGIGIAAGLQSGLSHQFAALALRHETFVFEYMAPVLLLLAGTGLYALSRRYAELKADRRRHGRPDDQSSRLALSDALTGLANRRLFTSSLTTLLAGQRRDDQRVAVLRLDLDGFRSIEDQHGQAVADMLLQAAAQRLKAVVRDTDCLARWGVDEFAIALVPANANDLARVATRILATLQEPFAIGSLLCRVTARLGVAVSSAETPLSAEDIVNRADRALVQAQDEDLGPCRFFDAVMDEHARERFRMERDIRQAIARREIQPHYQPLVRLVDGEVEGYEMLARWHHPIRGLIGPDKFIPVAEDAGLMTDMSLMLLSQACRDAQAWPAHIYVSINISPRQLRDADLCGKLMRVIEDGGLDPKRLEIEITEKGLVEDFDRARQVLRALKATGMTLALDDFGTGYSSLSHLRELPFDKLKIDRSFILTLLDSPENKKIVDAVITLGRSLGIKVTAEGIDSLVHMEWLRWRGCATGQGYYFGRPVLAAQVAVEWALASKAAALEAVKNQSQAQPDPRVTPLRAVS